ncbi:MAG: glycosyltransferase family 2 protein [Actinomycetes bacterium]
MATHLSAEQTLHEVDLSRFFVTTIIVSHNGAAWLPEVISSLSSQTRRINRIIAVDTGSTDASPKLLRAAGITYIAAEPDIGYGDAIEMALEHSPKFRDPVDAANECIWLIHDDCAPAKDALALLLEAINDRPQVVIAGPKLLGWYDRDHLLEAGISIARNGARWTGLEPREQDQGQHDETKEVLSVSTAGMLVRRAAFEEIGGLDPNLALFRDDVDLGWRARVAGFSAICVGAASAFHAEASASERRVVDVSEAFLHRPLLLDRRNAAYVMLANASWWMLPWLTFQLLGTSLLRVIFDLLAKLPGYAGDEIAAVALLIIHPTDLIKARRARRKKRLLSPSVVGVFIPPRGSQIRAGVDRVTNTISQKLQGAQEPLEDNAPQTYADIGVMTDEFDDQDSQQSASPSIFRGVLLRPDSLALVAIFTLSLISARARFGSLSGGALGFIPSGGGDLLRNYAQAWHLVGMGSAAAAPPWLAVLGVASLVTFGHLSLFITLLFLLTPSLAFIIFVNSLRRIGISQGTSTFGGIIYILTPLLWSSLNQGRIEILVLYLLAPLFIFLKPLMMNITELSWRRIFALTLLVTLATSFSPLLVALWLLVQIALLVPAVIPLTRSSKESAGWIDLLESADFEPVARRGAVIITTFLLALPWSLGALIHPTQFLLAPGIPLANGGTVQTLLTNPGGQGSPPWWIIAPIPLFIFFSFFIRSLRRSSLFSSAILAGAILLNEFHIDGHGATESVFVGSVFIVIAIILIPPMMVAIENVTPNLRLRNIGIGHLAVAGATVLSLVSATLLAGWILFGQAPSLVQSDQNDVVPAFVSALAQSPAKPKTLVLSSSSKASTFFISRGNRLIMGDADVATSIPPQIADAVGQLVSGSGVTSAKVLGQFGIQYLFLKAPVSVQTARVIDGVGGFTRMSATNIGVVWRIVGASPRILLTDTFGKNYMIPSGDIGALAYAVAYGTITLGEKYDQSWRLIDNGVNDPLRHAASGLPIFSVATPGKITLLFDGTAHRALISLELLALLVAVVMALPSGRRRLQVPLEELV